MKDIVLQCIAKAQRKYSFELSGFGILDNEFRITIRTINTSDTISKIMQHIKANITRRVNRRVGRTGTIWNSRFSSMVVECIAETAAFIRRQIYAAVGEMRKKSFLPYDATFSSVGVYQSLKVSGLAVAVHQAFSLLGLHARKLQMMLRSFEMIEPID